MEELYVKTWNLISVAKNILIVSHRKPDADTLGAAVVFRILAERLCKKFTLACVDVPGKSFKYIPHLDEFVSDFVLEDYDLVIIVDAGASYMTDFHLKYPNFLKSGVATINIDHHASNDMYGTLNVVDPNAPSTTFILYKFLKYFKLNIEADIATCLLGGLYGDTGSFMHSNTSKEVFEMAAELLEKGARIAEITTALFSINSLSTLKLWGKVLENAVMTDENVVMSVVREDDYQAIGANVEHLSGVIDYLNMVPDSKFAVLVNEDQHGNVKGSFRTRNEGVDLSRIASVFGGGGHPKASGFSIPGRLLPEVRYSIVSDHLSKKYLEF